MSNSFVTPTPTEISSLLAVIFGENISVSDSEPLDLNSQHVATFIDDEDKVVALCACDIEFVAYSGAALSMIPADVANEMISGRSVTDAMHDNFYEVMNICSKLLMSDSSAHLRLGKTMIPDSASEPIAALQDSAKITGFDIDIPKYGKGSLTFVVS